MARQQEKHREKSESRASAPQAGRRHSRSQNHNGEDAREAAERAGESARRAGRQMQEGLQQGAHEITAMGERAFEAWMQSSNEAMRRVIDMNVEIANWSREQLDDSINAVRSLAQCRSVGDAYGVQIGLLRTSMEKSMRHAGNVFNLVSRAMASGMQRSQRTGAAAMHEMQSTRQH